MKNFFIVLLFPLFCSATDLDKIERLARGESKYTMNCIGCHNIDPKKDSMGPAIYGSSFELLKSKVKHGSYPKNYKPKRSTRNMPTFPWLSDSDIMAIREYINN